MSLEKDILSLGKRARAAARELAVMRTARKNSILEAMADELEARRDQILEANAKDLEAGKESGLSNAMIDRLDLNGKRFEGMVNGVANLVALKDPVGRELSNWVRPNGLVISKVSVPIGVVGIIYESRPNVTADAAALCFKSGNASILRGGKEAFHSNCAIADAIQAGGEKKGLPENSIQLLRTTDRAAVMPLIKMKDHLDVIIPRGGEGLINFVAENASVPVLKHDKGVCHIYVDAEADQDNALDIIENAKVQRPGVCNAVETILVDVKIAEEFLPKVANRLLALGRRRGDRPHRHLRQRPQRSRPVRQRRSASRVHPGGRREHGLYQRLHPLHRRCRVRTRRGNRHQHQQAACAGSDGLGRADDLQVCCDRYRSDPFVRRRVRRKLE